MRNTYGYDSQGANRGMSRDMGSANVTPKRTGRSSYKEWKETRAIPDKLNNSVALANRKETEQIRNSFAEALNKDKSRVTVPAQEKSYMAQTKSKMQRL